MKTTLVNLTGEDIKYMSNDGEIKTIPIGEETIDFKHDTPDGIGVSIYPDYGMTGYPKMAGQPTEYGFRVYSAKVELPDNLKDKYTYQELTMYPEPKDGVVYIVPNDVAIALRSRDDILGQYTKNNVTNACWDSKTAKVMYRWCFMKYHE